MTRVRPAGRAKVYDLIDVGHTNNFFADGVLVHNCELLPNSEMSAPEYRQKHGIESVHTPVPFFHGTPSGDPHTEYFEIVVATSTLSREDWLRCQMLAWAVQAFHCLGATQALAVVAKHRDGISYRQFYEGLLRFAHRNPLTLLGTLYAEACDYFRAVQKGEPLRDFMAPEFGNVCWPPEEWAYLKAAEDAEGRFYRGLPHWIDDGAFLHQVGLTSAPFHHQPEELEFPNDLPEYVEKCLLGEVAVLNEGVRRYRYIPVRKYESLEEFAREVVWYSRKSGGKRVNVERMEP